MGKPRQVSKWLNLGPQIAPSRRKATPHADTRKASKIGSKRSGLSTALTHYPHADRFHQLVAVIMLVATSRFAPAKLAIRPGKLVLRAWIFGRQEHHSFYTCKESKFHQAAMRQINVVCPRPTVSSMHERCHFYAISAQGEAAVTIL